MGTPDSALPSIPMILIPGLLCNETLWKRQIADLRGYVQIIVADITGQSSVSEMAAAVLQSVPEEFSLVGFSLGSQVALEIMRTAKHRVQRLALLSATHGGLLPATATAMLQAIATIEQGRFEQYLDAVYPTYVAARRADDWVVKRSFVDMANEVGQDAGVRQMRALLAITSAFSGLDQIACRTIIAGGTEDRRTTPAAHKKLAEEIPGAELVLINDAGHFTPIEQPDAVTQLLKRWLAV